MDQVANAEYERPTPAESTIKLIDGKFRQAVTPGSASEVTIQLIPDLLAIGDLDGDGIADATAVLAGSAGGSGTFISLAALLNQDGAPTKATTIYLGDRVSPTSVRIEGGEIEDLALIRHGPSDPLCCPTQPVTRRFRFDNGSLIEITPTP